MKNHSQHCLNVFVASREEAGGYPEGGESRREVNYRVAFMKKTVEAPVDEEERIEEGVKSGARCRECCFQRTSLFCSIEAVPCPTSKFCFPSLSCWDDLSSREHAASHAGD